VLLFVCWPVCSCCCIRLQSAPRLFGLCRRSIRRAPCRDLAYVAPPLLPLIGGRMPAVAMRSCSEG
jgi:hypothetical protein